MEAQSTTLSISSLEMDSGGLQKLTRDLCTTINRETDMNAVIAEMTEGVGTKGDVVTLGTILLSFVTGGGAIALINVLKAYVDRGSQLEMRFEKDGKILNISSKNMELGEINQTIEKTKKFFS